MQTGLHMHECDWEHLYDSVEQGQVFTRQHGGGVGRATRPERSGGDTRQCPACNARGYIALASAESHYAC